MKDTHYLITGGSSGIGLAIAQALHEKGAFVHICCRDQDRLNAALERIGPRCLAYQGDVAIPAERTAMMDAVASASGGRLDGLVVNAAKYGFCNLLDMSAQDVDAYFQVNVISSFDLIRLAHPLLLKGTGKSILTISSTLGERPIPGTGAYSATKAALNMLTRSFALELAPDKIRVNSILPGVVDTPIHEPQTPNDPARADKMEAMAPVHPLGRVGVPEDIAKSALFLLSPDASWVTGSLFFVDGGISLV